jgi:polar amino acid transport system permease protein
VVRALGRRALALPIVAFADIMRSLPPLVVLIVLYFGLPALGLPLSAFAVTWLSLSLVLAAYAEESIWAGICTVPSGQLEAARSTMCCGRSSIDSFAGISLTHGRALEILPALGLRSDGMV